MTLAAILALIQQFGPIGIQIAEQLWKMFQSGGNPTQADWDVLKALASKTARQQMLDALAKAGIDPNSEQGKAMLALVP